MSGLSLCDLRTAHRNLIDLKSFVDHADHGHNACPNKMHGIRIPGGMDQILSLRFRQKHVAPDDINKYLSEPSVLLAPPKVC